MFRLLVPALLFPLTVPATANDDWLKHLFHGPGPKVVLGDTGTPKTQNSVAVTAPTTPEPPQPEPSDDIPGGYAGIDENGAIIDIRDLNLDGLVTDQEWTAYTAYVDAATEAFFNNTPPPPDLTPPRYCLHQNCDSSKPLVP